MQQAARWYLCLFESSGPSVLLSREVAGSPRGKQASILENNIVFVSPDVGR